MRSLKSIMLIIVMGLFMFDGIAQAKNKVNVPQAVTLSLSNKYPGATIKKWETKANRYTAKAVISGHNYFVSFDKNGHWLSTASNIAWQWSLPANIKTAYSKTGYNTWNVYYSKKIEKPSGEYYQLMVDDSNLHLGPNTRPLYTTDKMLEFKADGTLAMVKDITETPVP